MYAKDIQTVIYQHLLCYYPFTLTNLLTTFLQPTVTLPEKIFHLVIMNTIRMIISLCGIAWLLFFTRYLIDVLQIKLHTRLAVMSGYCFGVYLYQQFILKFLYYPTNLPKRYHLTLYHEWVSELH